MHFGKTITLPQLYRFSDDTYNGSDYQTPEDYAAFWYHPDHLGSSSYITNLAGEITQHMEYLPFGETLIEEHLNSNNSPFKFNAKEMDAETGNYYYGARYYDPKWSIWLSVDPLAEQFPNWSPYSYVYNNPLNYTDSTGMCPDGYCPDDVNGGELDEVVVTAPEKNRTWTSEIQAYNGTPEQYQKDYPEFAGMGDGEMVDHHEKNYGQEYRDWERKVQGEYRLGQFINKLKLGLYDTGVLDYSRIYLEVAIGGESAPFIGKQVINSANRVQKLTQTLQPLRINNPSVLNKTLPGYTDAVEGTIFRQGRGALSDYLTKKPALIPLNSQKFSKYGQWGTGIGLSGTASFYYYKKMLQKK